MWAGRLKEVTGNRERKEIRDQRRKISVTQSVQVPISPLLGCVRVWEWAHYLTLATCLVFSICASTFQWAFVFMFYWGLGLAIKVQFAQSTRNLDFKMRHGRGNLCGLYRIAQLMRSSVDPLSHVDRAIKGDRGRLLICLLAWNMPGTSGALVKGAGMSKGMFIFYPSTTLGWHVHRLLV